MNNQCTFNNAEARFFCFDNGKGTAEFHVTITILNPVLTYQEQVETLMNTFKELHDKCMPKANVILKKYFLSDASNQTDLLMNYELEAVEGALSVIQQAPLNGTKIALWAYLVEDVTTKSLSTGLYEAAHGTYRHLWLTNANNKAKDSERQTRILLNDYVMQLLNENCSLADNCIRTWFYVNDVDINYAGMVKARNEVFITQNLTDKTHFIASTGIGGRQADANVLSQMDAYAIEGVCKEQVKFLYGASHLNRTSDYGVSFERGTCVDYGDRRHVFISGTASINNKGEIMYPGDVRRQCQRMWENVETLLAEGGCTFEDAAYMVVYLRDPADYCVISKMFEEKFPGKPYIIVNAKVCRPGWLIEMETWAVRKTKTDFPDF